MELGYNPRLKALILEVVDNQINDNDPPITRKTMERLKAAGYTEKKAKEMIAAVVVSYIYEIMKDGKDFDVSSYTRDLKRLS